VEKKVKFSILINQIGKISDPVPQSDEIPLPVENDRLLQEGLMAVADDDGIISLEKLSPGETLHFPHQGIWRVAQVILAETGTDGGDFPEDRGRDQGLEPPGKGAPEKPPEPEVGPVFPVDRVPVGDVKKLSIKADGEMAWNDNEPPIPEKIVEEEIVVSFKIINGHPFGPEGEKTIHHGPEGGINTAVPAEPEIEEIPHQEQTVEPAAEIPEEGQELF